MTKSLALALLLLAPALAFAATPATVESRSPLHSLVIDVVPVGDEAQYAARVTELKSGELLAAVNFEPGVFSAQSVNEKRGLDIRINLRPTPGGLHASLSIRKNGAVVDVLDGNWTLEPRPTYAGALRVGGDVKAPIVVHKVEPQYTDEARKARISGIVIVEVVIDETGTVRDVVVLKPLPFGLDQAAVDAVRQWRFKPATMKGQPVKVLFNLTVNFKLDAPRDPNALPVGGDVTAPVPVQKANPLYPHEARANRISGTVILEAIIDKNGVPRDIRVLKPLPYGLDQAAVDALRQWRFRPGTMKGEPVDVLFNITFSFNPD